MTISAKSAIRERLCSRVNGDRLAQRLCEDTSDAFAVVRTDCLLQPYRVKRTVEADDSDQIELEIIAL